MAKKESVVVEETTVEEVVEVVAAPVVVVNSLPEEFNHAFTFDSEYVAEFRRRNP